MKLFIQNNRPFTCLNCGEHVDKHPSSSRDHCNHCLYGLHVDVNPGDRMNDCKGILKPIGLKLNSKKEQIAYECEKCGQKVFCIIAPDDNNDKIIKLSKLIWQD